MVIHAGIVVVKQITDELKWYHAMEHIWQEFRQEDYFEILPHFNHDEFKEVNLKKFVIKFNLDEAMNFSRNGFQGIDRHWREFPYKEDLSKLKLELTELKKKKEEIEKDERQSFGKYEQKILDNLTKAIEFKEKFDDEAKEESLARRVSHIVKISKIFHCFQTIKTEVVTIFHDLPFLDTSY